MNYAIVATKIDPQTKKLAMETAHGLGLPLSVVIKAFLKQFIRTKSITFNTSEEPSTYLKNAIAQAEKNLSKGSYSPTFKTGADAVAWLEKQGI